MAIGELSQALVAQTLFSGSIDGLLIENGFLCPGVFPKGGFPGFLEESVEFKMSPGGIPELQEDLGPGCDRIAYLRVIRVLFDESLERCEGSLPIA